jgi:hypothetical protein
MDDERYFTVNNLLLSILAVAVFSFIFGFVVGVYARKSVEPEYSIVETTSNSSTTEEIKTTTTTEAEATTTETETATAESKSTSKATSTSTTSTTTVTSSKGVKTGEDEKLTLLGKFKGTYYAGKTVPCKGGSGRTLVGCTVGSDGVKGSVASRYAYEKWGYKANGGRTKLYLEVKGYESMNGWYWVDDCNAVSSIIDFYYYKNSNCPFQKAGVVEVKAYVYTS